MNISHAKKETIKAGGLSLLANIIGKSISMPVGIVVASILGPGDYGTLAIINLVLQYLGYLNLGFLTNLSREIPIAYGKNDKKEVEIIYSTVLTNFTITNLIGISILGGAYIFDYGYGDEFKKEYILLMAFIKVAACMNSYNYSYIKGEGKFFVYAKYETFTKITTPIANLIFVYFLGLSGMLISMAFSQLMGASFAYLILDKPKLRFSINLKKTKELLETGFLMYLNNIIDSIFFSIGIFLAGSMLTPEDVGILSFTLVIAITEKVPFASIYRMTIIRKMALDGGEFGINNYSIFRKYFGSHLVIYAILMSTFMGIYVIFYCISIKLYLYQFQSSIPIFIILFFSSCFYNIRKFMYGYFNVTKQMKKRSYILIIGTIVSLFFGYFLVKIEIGVIGIAVAMSLAFLIVSFYTFFTTFSQIFPQSIKKYLFILKICVISSVLTYLLFVMNEMSIIDYNVVSVNYIKLLWAFLEFFIKCTCLILISLTSFIFLFWSDNVHLEILKVIYFLRESLFKK